LKKSSKQTGSQFTDKETQSCRKFSEGSRIVTSQTKILPLKYLNIFSVSVIRHFSIQK